MVKTKGKKNKKAVTKEKFSFKGINKFDNYIMIIGLVLTGIIAYFMRSWPIRFNRLLGYDPYFFLREAAYYLSGGLPEIDPMAPTVVRSFVTEDLQGLPILTSTISKITGIDLLKVHIYLPVFIGVIGAILIYFVALKAWGNRYIALISSFFLAIMPAFIYRTSGGGMWKDTVGSLFFIIFMLLAIYMLKEKERNKILIYGALSLVVLILYANTFGNFFFVPLIVATYVLFKPFIKETKKSKNVANLKDKILNDIDMWALVAVCIISLLYAYILVPPYKFESLRIYLALMGLGFAAIINLSGYFAKDRKYYLAFMAILSVVLIALAEFVLDYNVLGYIFRSVDISGISGQGQASTFSDFVDKFYLFPIMAAIGAIYGIYQVIHHQNVKPTLFLLSAFAFNTFMSYQMLRNSFFGGITFAIIAAFGFMGIYDFLTNRLSKEKALTITVIALIVFSSFSLYNPLDQRYGGSIPYRTAQSPHLEDRWLSALVWLKDNTPQDEVVCNWWDYGYWIQTVGGKRTISDGMRTEMGPWITGFGEFLGSTDSTGIQKIVAMEQEAYRATGNNFRMNYVLVDQSLLIKTTVLNSVIGRDTFRTAYFYFRGTSRLNNATTYVYESGATRLFLVVDETNTYCYIEQNNQRYGVSNFVIENPNGQNFVYENVQYNFQSIPQIMYLTQQNAIMMPDTIKDTLFARLIVYERGLQNYNLVYDNGYVKIYRILR
ncbi:MAG: Oligosaccharyl transferase STT3 subunit [Candidatus Methanofastidiosum methylothiophilum]|uniref:dolichyl-phosphooligosaccharide-protein glycotransferase n=1 Tax=Candidatus Methanofastidiosum methylothiophilum TaxID=1705564 RepID=A0A150IXA9_9EURY|nr:MAG: Oligosaccharyl transferase STT3 subunit [Candidatus Methanofastidiosum methylthiophilus]KYC47425.1 MAG: Oligosaccharyl transferase STT3 subunit [Candidatus Methanofastidiosum methylthiophilus]KYC49609.1 MAG: Oligosaccharyl transferase STT3 subunit [Candidatus Methanofastidiosum methylthiophilus]